MSKSEIIAELSSLSPEDRQEIRLRLAELDNDPWLDDGLLSDAEKRLIEERFSEMEDDSSPSIPWAKAKARFSNSFPLFG